MSARDINLTNAVLERERQTNARLQNPGLPQVNIDPGWDAYYGGLHAAKDRAAEAGLGFGVNYSGFGQDRSGSLGPFVDPLTLKTNAINAALSEMPTAGQRDMAVQAQGEDLRLRRAAADQAEQQGRDQQALDRSLAPPIPPQVTTQTPGVNGQPPTITMHPAQTESPRDRVLNSLPGHLRPIYEQAFAKQDLEKQAAELAVRKQTEVERENRAKDQAANPFGAVAGGPTAGPSGPAGASAPAGAPAQGVTGEAFLKTLPPALAKQVQAYAEGRMAFPSGFALKVPYFQQMLQAVGQYDPSFDAVNFNARNKAYSDLTSPNGTGGKTINALNTAVSHIGQLSDLIEKLGNTNYSTVNAVENTVGKLTGSTKVTNFEAVQPQAMKEIERLWRGAGGSQGEIDKLKNSLGSNMGIQQQREALANFADLMMGKLDATRQQRDNVLGPTAAARVPILFDQNRGALGKIFQRAGMTPPDSLGGGGSAAPAGAQGGAPAEGAQQSIPGVPGGIATFRGGKWIRTK